MRSIQRCANCGSTVENAPMRVSTCVDCGGNIEIVPAAPDSAPKYIAEGLEKQSPETLREIAEYAAELADHKEQQIEDQLADREVDLEETPDESDADEWEDAIDDSDAPPQAYLTQKTIDGRQYFYYQWREGNSVKSEYVAPVDPA